MKMRRSQQIIFWRNHKVYELKKDGKVYGWYGKKFPKTAQKIINEVKEK